MGLSNCHVQFRVRATCDPRTRNFPFCASVAQQPVNKEKTNPSLSLRFQRESCAVLQSLQSFWKRHTCITNLTKTIFTQCQRTSSRLWNKVSDYLLLKTKMLTSYWRKLILSCIARIWSAKQPKLNTRNLIQHLQQISQNPSTCWLRLKFRAWFWSICVKKTAIWVVVLPSIFGSLYKSNWQTDKTIKLWFMVWGCVFVHSFFRYSISTTPNLRNSIILFVFQSSHVAETHRGAILWKKNNVCIVSIINFIFWPITD